MNKLKKINFITAQGLYRCISRTSNLWIDHYSVLGIHRSSTQAEIKAAYYKLSKMYHPDKNSDFEAIKKFRDVNEAYEILGNVKTKKLYDKGIFQGSKPVGYSDVSDDKYKENRHKTPAYGKTTIYDFDMWTKEHYSQTFKDHITERKLKKRGQQRRQDTSNFTDSTFSIIPFMILLMIVIFGSFREDHDKISVKRDKND